MRKLNTLNLNLLVIIIMVATIIIWIVTLYNLYIETQELNDTINIINEKNKLIEEAYQLPTNNVYTSEIKIKNNHIDIPIHYKGTTITLRASNYTEYRNSNMSKVYNYLDTQYNPNTVACTIHMTLKWNNTEQFDPFSEDYRGPTCIPTNIYINLEPINKLWKINEGE